MTRYRLVQHRPQPGITRIGRRQGLVTTVQNGGVPASDHATGGSASPAVPDPGSNPAERMQHRYPARRRSKWMLVVVLAVLVAGGLGWLGWTAWHHSHPPVSGRVSLWKVRSDRKADFTLTVDRPDPSVPVKCRVIAQATSYEHVGDLTVAVPATKHGIVDVKKTMRTLHRATSVSLDKCWTT